LTMRMRMKTRKKMKKTWWRKKRVSSMTSLTNRESLLVKICSSMSSSHPKKKASNRSRMFKTGLKEIGNVECNSNSKTTFLTIRASSRFTHHTQIREEQQMEDHL
jgi:hypothetical protein